MDSSETTPRRKDAQRNREAILSAAKELFATSADVPMYEIARAAGIGQGTLYRHFADRRSIAIALFDEALVLAERSGMPCDLLRSEILNWRSRCRRRQRDLSCNWQTRARFADHAGQTDGYRVNISTR